MRSFSRFAAVAALTLAAGLTGAPAAQADVQDIEVKENEGRIKATGPGFVLKLTKHGIEADIDDDSFGDPSTGNPIQRSVLDLAGRTLRPFECENGTYTIKSGTFERTLRVSLFAQRPAPYPPGMATAFPGFLSPFVGVIDGTVTDADGQTLRVLVSDLAYEARTADGGFTSTSPIHGLFVDQDGRVRDRISLFGRFSSGPNGENARHWIEDRGTCRQIADLPFGPGSENAVVTGPLFVLPFQTTVIVPEK